MADNPAPSSVASRFVSESTLEAAQAQRKKDWEAAYARIGEEPPKQEESNEPYDGRSLWEKLQENKNKKQETFDEAMKFKNQFRALDQDEISFLDSITEDNTEEEQKKAAAIKEELDSFRKAVLSRQVAPPPSSLPGAPTLAPVASTSAPASASPNLTPSAPPHAKKPTAKKQKKTLPGLIVKKKEKPKPVVGVKRTASEDAAALKEGGDAKMVNGEGESKKRKVEEDKP